MSNPKKPRKLPKAELIRQALHQRVAHERSHAQAAARDAYLRKLMDLPPASPHDMESERK